MAKRKAKKFSMRQRIRESLENDKVSVAIIPIARVQLVPLLEALPYLENVVLQTGFGEFIIPNQC
jgi:hypothetical protein